MPDLEAGVPSAATISDSIRDTVISIHEAGDDDNLTVNYVRSGVEEKLGLPAGFLKDGEWKDKSKQWIKDAVNRYCADDPAPDPSPKKATKTKSSAKAGAQKITKKPAADSAPREAKRKAAASTKKPNKRRRNASSDEESEAALPDSPAEGGALSGSETELPIAPTRRPKRVVAEDSDEEDKTPKKPSRRPSGKTREVAGSKEEGQSALPTEKLQRPATPPPAANNNASDDEMSDVLDKTPVKNRKNSKAGKQAKIAEGAKAKTVKTKVEDDPDQAEIKRLQSWLVKCGIRKVWGKELKDCETSKDKIRHLKGMLKDAGMDGKFTLEKAAKIKEQREFAKDLEDIQAGAAAWGETSSTGRPRRAAAAARTVQSVVPNDSDEDEEDNAQGEEDDRTDDDDDDDDDEVDDDSRSDDSGSGKDDDDGEVSE